MERFRHYEPTLRELIEDAPLKLLLARRQINPSDFEQSMNEAAARIIRHQDYLTSGIVPPGMT